MYTTVSGKAVVLHGGHFVPVNHWGYLHLALRKSEKETPL